MIFTKGKVNLMQGDCMDLMRSKPDNYYDLAVVDPEYGINRDGGESGKNWKKHKKKNWDKNPPPPEYFKEMFRVSKDQIIWGANYFTKYIPKSMGWIVWDKGQKLTMSDGELAFTSYDRALRIKTINRVEISRYKDNIHPTQKPVKLYDWIFHNYAKPEFKILDTHGGSMSSAIAAYYFGCEFDCIELDKDYYNDAVKRFKQMTMQTKLF